MTFFAGAWAKIAAVLAAVGAAAILIWRIFAAGKSAERAKQTERVVKAVGEAKRVEDSVRAKTDGELDAQLRHQREQLK